MAPLGHSAHLTPQNSNLVMEVVGAEAGRVCVTGAGGYLASWLVKLLLSKGYTVHGTVRDPSDEKNAHLKKLEKADEHLQLFKADLLDYDAIASAIAGCEGVFHVASPVPSANVPKPGEEIVATAVTGTLNVLKACSEAKVKRVVVVSSGGAVSMSLNWRKGTIMDEDSWSDTEYCRTQEDLCTGKIGDAGSKRWTLLSLGLLACSASYCLYCNWYCLSKTIAESEALEYGKKQALDVITVCPTLIFGPLLQSTVNASSLILINILKGARESVENGFKHFVDVRDVADALFLVYSKPKASGRYICAPHRSSVRDLIDLLKSLYPNYQYPKEFIEVDEGSQLSSEKLKSLGWKWGTLKESLVDSVEYYRSIVLLD